MPPPMHVEADPSSPVDQVAGWQPDPRGQHQLRYFDGRQWTDHVTHSGPVPCDGCADSPV